MRVDGTDREGERDRANEYHIEMKFIENYL